MESQSSRYSNRRRGEQRDEHRTRKGLNVPFHPPRLTSQRGLHQMQYSMLAAAALICLLLQIVTLPFADALQSNPYGITRHTSRQGVIIPFGSSSAQFGCRFPLLSRLGARSGATTAKKSTGWFPKPVTYDDDIFSEDAATAELEERVVLLAAHLIRHRLWSKNNNNIGAAPDADDESKPSSPRKVSDEIKQRTRELVKGRFMDLTCTQSGEDALERLFCDDDQIVADIWDIAKETAALTDIEKDDVIRGAVMVVQSLCVLGTQVGVKGLPEQLRRMVDHLADGQNGNTLGLEEWNNDSVRRLKYKLDRAPAQQLMAELQRKQAPQAAFDLLVALGAWEKHEDLALLRSGFPIRFTEVEEQAATDAIRKVNEGREGVDPDSVLGLRQDLRHLKVYTIDGASTAEIDDGVSIEVFPGDGEGRHRIWVHIADAERWAPPDSDLFETARRRITSLYLPHGSISMFPTTVGTDLMSLKANQDVCALSLGVELNDDGSIDESSLVVTPSLIRVSYRLTYDDVNEMLEEGIAYSEEWELGTLLMAATKRREFRIRNGSTEGMVPNPVPFAAVSIFPDKEAPDSVGISVNVEVSHNAANNKTATAEVDTDASSIAVLAEPVSAAYLLVTEAMILAGEALGRWKGVVDTEEDSSTEESDYENCLRLPFRTQREPDFKSRSRERNVMIDLLESNVGSGLCHAWYTRRFLGSVSVTEIKMPHSGLGLECYVQWSSPIRRFSDLQVHASVKRYLRRRRVYELLQNGQPIPEGVSAFDLGIPPEAMGNGRLSKDAVTADDLGNDINYMEGVGLIGAGKRLQRQSQQYWLFEYVRRLKETDPDTTFSIVVLGCVDPEKSQFAIFVKELGLEHRYTSPGGRLEPGTELLVKVDNIQPRSGLLSFVLVV